MKCVDLLKLAVLAMLAQPLFGQIPPRYELIQIEDSPDYNGWPSMNNLSQVVYCVDVWTSRDVVLWDNGVTTRLTDDPEWDSFPDINDPGQIVWARQVNGRNTPWQIMLLDGGELTQLTFSDRNNGAPRINNQGHIVWYRDLTDDGCGGLRADIFFYDGEAIHRITTNGETDDLVNQLPEINDLDQIVWTEYNFCNDPWTSRVMMYSDGVINQISPPEQSSPGGPFLNNCGLVAWNEDGIWLWDNGVVSLLTDWGGGPRPNDRGEIAFARDYEGPPVDASEVWFYRNGEFYQITDNPHDQGWDNWWNPMDAINEKGEILFRKTRPWYDEAYIYLMALRSDDRDSSGSASPIDVKRTFP